MKSRARRGKPISFVYIGHDRHFSGALISIIARDSPTSYRARIRAVDGNPGSEGSRVDWPKALKDYRRQHSLTQAALAEILNVDHTTISRWERGRDAPALNIQRRLKSLVIRPSSDVERAIRMLIDTSDRVVVLFDRNYRLVHSSPRHRELLRLDGSDLYGKPFQRFQTQSHAAALDGLGGPEGWWRNGVVKMELSLLRRPLERARNPLPVAQKGAAWSIRDGVASPFVLGLTREIPLEEYDPCAPVVTTLDDPLPR